MKISETHLRRIIKEAILQEKRTNADYYHSSHTLIGKAMKTLKQAAFEIQEAGSELPQPSKRNDPTDKAQKSLWDLSDQCDDILRELDDIQDDVHDLKSNSRD